MKSFLVTVFLFMMLQCLQPAEGGSKGKDNKFCSSTGYTYIRGLDVCIKFHNTNTSWTEAQATCVGENAKLVALTTLEKDVFMKDYVLQQKGASSSFWIGAVWQGGVNTNWQWVTGESVPGTYENWIPGEPSVGTEIIFPCASYLTAQNGWYASLCNCRESQAYVSLCENQEFN